MLANHTSHSLAFVCLLMLSLFLPQALAESDERIPYDQVRRELGLQ